MLAHLSIWKSCWCCDVRLASMPQPIPEHQELAGCSSASTGLICWHSTVLSSLASYKSAKRDLYAAERLLQPAASLVTLFNMCCTCGFSVLHAGNQQHAWTQMRSSACALALNVSTLQCNAFPAGFSYDLAMVKNNYMFCSISAKHACTCAIHSCVQAAAAWCSTNKSTLLVHDQG